MTFESIDFINADATVLTRICVAFVDFNLACFAFKACLAYTGERINTVNAFGLIGDGIAWIKGTFVDISFTKIIFESSFTIALKV